VPARHDIPLESGHSIAWEQPEVSNEKVLDFIARH
jgi:hypothetical protein